MSEFKNLEISNVYFDIHNPRSKYASSVEIPEDPFNEEHQKTLIPDLLKGSEGHYSVQNLRSSIEECGRITNPIQVKVVGDKYVCVEGNTRLLIYKELYKSAETDDEKEKWSKIPAQVYENITAEQEARLKLTAHVVGARDWKPYARAKYIEELKNTTTLDWQSITQVVGGRQATMMKLYDAVTRYDKYFLPLTNIRDEKKFSHYVESENDVIKSSIEEHDFSEKDFANWVAENKFKMAINVRKLPKILDNPDAKEAFIRGDYDDAAPWITPQNDGTISLSSASTPALIEALSERVKKFDRQFFDENREIILDLNTLIEDIDSALDSAED